jgi:hypothetical protein
MANKWSTRFIWAAIIQGLFAVGWTLFLAWPFGYLNPAWNISPSPAMIIAGGSAGTWLLLGYALFLMVGVFATAASSIFYGMMDTVHDSLAWLHLALMNIGVVGATWLLMIGGYLGGGAMLAVNEGGKAWNAGQVHVNILQYYPEPIGIFVLIAILGVLFGGLGYILSLRKKS